MTDDLIEEGNARPNMGLHPGLWIGFLLPPVIWAGQMQLNYWALRGACARGGNSRLYLVTAAALLLILLSELCAWVAGRKSSAGERVEWGTLLSSSRFVLALGLLSGGVFFIAVLAQGIAAIIFHPCQL